VKHQSAFFSLTHVVIILTAVFFFGAQADDRKGRKDPRAEKFHAAEKEINAAVKAGKHSKKDAQKKLRAIKKQIWTDKGKEQNRGGKDPRAEKFRAAEEKIWGAVKAGKLSKEAAHKKLTGLKKAIWGGDLKKDSGDKKGSGDKKEGYDKREAKFHAFEKEIWGAVKAGKLSKKEAMSKLEVLKGQIWGDKKDWDGKKDPDIEVLKRQLEALKRENEGLRKRLEKRKDR
jgi:hypothetical protein